MILDYLNILRGWDWKEMVFKDYGFFGQPRYICGHKTHKTAESAEGWQIIKISYDGDGNPTRWSGPLVGTVDGRATLSW